MTTRVQTLTSPGFADANDVTYKGIPISCYLKTPGAVSVLDLEGHILSDGTQYGVGTTSDLVTGAFSLSAIYVGDLRFADGSAAACQLAVAGGNQLIESPVAGYTYASSINISTWMPTPSSTGKTLMILDADLVSDAPYLGLVLPIDISVTAIKPDSSVLFAGQPVSYAASAGRISALLDPTSTLSVPTARYKITPPGATWYFDVPVNPTGYQGAYSAGTTYNAHDGSSYQGPLLTPLLTPPDVVLDGGIPYKYINATPAAGHTPASSPTYWAVWQGEPIVWHLTAVAITGAVAINTANLAHDSNLPVILDDAVASPSTLHDDIANIARRTSFTTAAKTTTYATTNADDWLFVSGASGAWNLTVQAASTRTRPLYVFLTDATHAVTLLRTGADTFNGATSLVLSTLYQWVCLKPPSSGTAWAALIPGSGGGAAAPSYVWLAKSANYTALITDTNILVDASGGAVTITLFTAVGYTGRISIKKKDSSANAVNIKTVSAQTIDGVNYATSPLPITTQYASVSLVGDNSAFWIE